MLTGLSRLAAVFASVAALGSIVACSDAPTSSSLPKGEKSSPDEKTPTKDTPKATTPAKDTPTSGATTTPPSTGTPTTTTGAPVQGTGVCAGKADSTACYTCCEGISPEAKAASDKETAIGQKYKACACVAAKCATECATDYCSADSDPTDDATEGSACETCLTAKAADCDAQTQPETDALEATPGYIALDKCITDAKCDAMADAEGD